MREKITRFMYGRYGFDLLSGTLFLAGSILTSIFSFFDFYPLRLIGVPFYAVAFLRILSKDTEKRRSENAKFMTLIDPLIRKMRVYASEHMDKQHRYFRCPGCKRTLRVPRGRGKIKISCPHCHREFVKKT